MLFSHISNYSQLSSIFTIIFSPFLKAPSKNRECSSKSQYLSLFHHKTPKVSIIACQPHHARNISPTRPNQTRKSTTFTNNHVHSRISQIINGVLTLQIVIKPHDELLSRFIHVTISVNI